jgi:hypothetical protein
MLPGTRWQRINHVNPRANAPIEATVLKNTGQEAIFQLKDGYVSYLTWPHHLGLQAAPVGTGWHIKDPEGRTLVSYTPLDNASETNAKLESAAQEVVGTLLEYSPDFEQGKGQVSSLKGERHPGATAESIMHAVLEDDDEEEHFVGFDLDGTLAKILPGKYRHDKIGEPIPKTVAKLRRLVSHGKKVKIFTARADDEKSIESIRKWLKSNDLPHDLEITNVKEPGMDKFYDDKAVAVQKNTGVVKDSLYADFPWDYFLIEVEQAWEPPPQLMAWFKNLLRMLNPVAEWAVPATGQVYKIDQKARTVTLVVGEPNDPDHWHDKTKAVFQKLGYTVHDSPDNPDEMAFSESLIAESPEISTLKKNQIKLDPEERDQVMRARAVWHMGKDSGPSPAVRKAKVRGKTWYWCATHRFGQVRPTLRGAIKAFDKVKETA